MDLTLRSIWEASDTLKQRLVLIHSDVSQNSLPLFRQAIIEALKTKLTSAVLLATGVPTISLVPHDESNLIRLEWSDQVPDYEWKDPRPELFQAVRNASGPVLVAIESIDTLCQDVGSVSQVYKFIRSLLALVMERPAPSRLLITLNSTSPLLPRLIPPSVSPTLALVGLHSPILIRYLAESYLTPPPPLSSLDKFWTMLTPAVSRGESEQLAFSHVTTSDSGNSIVYDGRDPFSGIADVTIRGPTIMASGIGSSRAHKSVARSLEGWVIDPESGDVTNVPWDQLPTLRDLTSNARATTEYTRDHKDLNSLTFNVNLTDAQIAARAKVPLPYAHEGTTPSGQGQIIYDPDSADDLDDDDPDEDLDI